MRFWDSSAVVPLALSELRSRACSELYESDSNIVVWALTPIEVLSGVHRRRREGHLPPDAFDIAMQRLDRLRATWTEVLDVEVVRARAERIVAVHAVRAADALQLAAALIACAEQPHKVPFVGLDARLNDAARNEGFSVLPDGDVGQPDG